jgi:glyoxylate/hydroxypyruvate reductase
VSIETFQKKLLTFSSASKVEIICHTSEEERISREEFLHQVKGCTGIFCLLTERIDEEVLEHAGPQLKVVSTMSVGYNHIDIAACKKRHIQVGYTPGVLDISTAETAVALTFAVKRKLFECNQSARHGQWGVWQPFQ